MKRLSGLPSPQTNKQTKPLKTVKGLKLALTTLPFFFFKAISCLPFGIYTGRGRPLGLSPFLNTGSSGNRSPFRTPKPRVLLSDPFAKLPRQERGARPCRAAGDIPIHCRPRRRPDPGAEGGGRLGENSPGSARSLPTPAEAERTAPSSSAQAARRPRGKAPDRGARASPAHPHRGLWPLGPPQRALTPVPLSHTTTFLPWLSIVRTEESRRCRPTTYSRHRPALSSSFSSPFAAPPRAQLSSPARKSPPAAARNFTDGLSRKGRYGKEAETGSCGLQ